MSTRYAMDARHTAGNKARFRGDERGVALMGVLIFAVVVALTGLAFYAMASYEFKSAKDGQQSSESFYLADGAIERARGELLIDKTWRGPIAGAPLGSGTYTVSAADTLYQGSPAVLLHGAGFVGDGARGVDVFARVHDLLDIAAIFAGRDMDANGNLNVYGRIHVNGDGDFGPDDDHLKSGTYDEGYVVRPPAIYTDPDKFPNSTYYQVVIKHPGGQNLGEIHRWDRGIRQFKKIPGWPDIPNANIKLAGGSSPPDYEYTFSAGETRDWFAYSGAGSFFPLDTTGGDSSVVVDFGHPETGAIAGVDFALNDLAYPFETTIINTRFEGIDEGDNRIAPCSGFWVGGNVTFGNAMTWAPRNCVALITNHLGPPKGMAPNAQGSLGTAANPALTYVTGNVEGIKGQLEIHGILISLCDISSQGGPDVWHEDIQDCIPQGLLSEDGSGFLEALEWREVGP